MQIDVEIYHFDLESREKVSAYTQGGGWRAMITEALVPSLEPNKSGNTREKRRQALRFTKLYSHIHSLSLTLVSESWLFKLQPTSQSFPLDCNSVIILCTCDLKFPVCCEQAGDSGNWTAVGRRS